jgi:tetratricopeptide (TPR) repeat protein
MKSRQKKFYVAWMPKIKKLGRFTLQVKNEIESDKILFNNYLINEIGSIEESGRQLISIYAILIGAYVTILINDVSITTLKSIKYVSEFYSNEIFSTGYIIFFIIFFPILFWSLGAYGCIKVIKQENYDSENYDSENYDPVEYLKADEWGAYRWFKAIKQENYISAEWLKTDELSRFLNKTIKSKYNKLYTCYLFLGSGLLIVFIIFSLNIIWPNTSPYQDATTYYRLGIYDEAIKNCNKTIAENPRFEGGWFVKGNCYWYLGNYIEAIKCYDVCIKLNNNPTQAWFWKGKSFVSLKMPNDAIESLDEAINLDPNCSKAWLWKGFAYEALKNYDEANKAFNETLRIDPTDEEARLRIEFALNKTPSGTA